MFSNSSVVFPYRLTGESVYFKIKFPCISIFRYMKLQKELFQN